MDGICEASNTLFKEFHNRENGGVFNVNNKNVVLNIKCSFFINNSVTEKGGCIYCSECKFNADMCSFFHCASFKHTDNYQGNIACTSNTDVHINNVNSLLCGYSELESSDSSFGLGNALFIIEYMNSSHNYGFGGGSGYSYSFCKENSYAKYTNILNGKDHHMIEAVYCEYNVYSSNFINCSELNAGIIYQSNDYSITFNSCNFLNTGTINFCVNAQKFNAINSYSDREYSPLIQTNNVETAKIKLTMHCPFLFCDCLNNSSSSKSILKTSLFTFLLT